MQYANRKLYCTQRKRNKPSVRIERIVSHPATLIITKYIFMLNLPDEMQYAIRELYPTDHKDTSRSERIAKHTAQFTTI